MKKVFRMNKITLILSLVFSGWLSGACAEGDSIMKDADEKGVVQLVFQELNYTENPIDIPNLDRGFYRPSSYIVPVDAIDEEPSFPDLGATIAGTTVFTNARIVYMGFDLRNFS